MTLDFDRMPSLVQPRFKGGQGEAETRIFQDDMGKILRLTLQPGSSIGLHTHEDSCEIMYFLSGTGVCLDDGADTADFRRLLEELRLAARDMTADRLLWKLYTECHALAVFGAMEGGAARKENLIALYTYAGQQAAAGRGGLFDFVTQLHDLLEEGRQPPITTRTAGSGVQIMSVHRSKGLEFPVVILTDLHKTFNADDFRRPVLVHPRLGLGTERVDREKRIRYDTVTKTAVAAALTRESKSEEMRILYVALTRAKEKLTLTNARQRMLFGRTTPCMPSQFLKEIPEENMEWLGKPEPRPASSWDDFGDGPAYAPQREARPGTERLAHPERPVRPAAVSAPLLQLQPGDGVRHSAFGQGMVLSVRPMGGDALVEVAFDRVGTKRLMLKAAGAHLVKL